MEVKNLDWFQDSAGFGLRVSVDCPNYAKELVDAFKSDNRPYEIDIRPAGTKRSLDFYHMISLFECGKEAFSGLSAPNIHLSCVGVNLPPLFQTVQMQVLSVLLQVPLNTY